MFLKENVMQWQRIKNYAKQMLLVVCTTSMINAAYDGNNKRFAIIIASRNNSEWCERNLDALRTQHYENWHAIYINDASIDDTQQKVEHFIKTHHLENKITLINNEEREGALSNIYKAIYMCDNQDIIVNYDGDDWFSGPEVLDTLNRVYADENVWITYGSYELYPSGERSTWVGGVSDEVIQTNSYRKSQSCTGHLRTFYAWLFKCIKTEDLKVDGIFFPMTYDLAMMFPMLELAGGKFKYIPDILYVYNFATPYNDCKINRDLQIRMDDIIRSRAPYQPLRTIPAFNSLENWNSMQSIYQELYNTLSSNDYQIQNDIVCHPYWEKTKKNIQKIVLGQYNPFFLQDYDIQNNMVRTGMTVIQAYELCFLQDCISNKTKNILSRFRDTSFGNLPKECWVLSCSSSTLGHLFYAARTTDLMDDEPKVILEFGGGYGNLARIYKSFFPKCTYIIIDLPEVLALQYFFLKETLPSKNIRMHTHNPESYEEGTIHLIPAHFLKDVHIVCNLFVSTFALSEASETAQNIVKMKNFFNAETVYIAGQLHGWGPGLNFVHHSNIHNGLRERYKNVNCHPLHLFADNLKSYEIIARNPHV